MKKREVVTSIVNLYELPKKIKDKVTNIAHQRIKELALIEYDDICIYTSSLIDKFQNPIPYQERFFTRLDHPKYDNSKTPFSELIDTSIYLKEIEPIKYSKQKTSLKEILDIFEKELDSTDFELASQLFLNVKGNFSFNVSPEYILNAIPKIQNRLEKLAKNNGKIVIPKRPIVHIKLSPLIIKFGRREYNKNPLKFYRANSEVYKGMSRVELQRFDPGLESSLRRYNQLDEATPRKYRDFKKKPLEYYRKYLKLYEEMSRAELQRFDPGLESSLRRYNQLDKAIPKKNRDFKKKPLKYYRKHLKLYEGMSRSELFKFDQGLYKSLIRWNQLETAIPKTIHRDFKKNPLAFFRKYQEIYKGMSRSELFKFDPSLYESLRRWSQLELAIPNVKDTKFKGLPKENIEEIIKFLKIHKSPTKVAKKLNISRATVDKYGLKYKIRKPNKRTGTPGYSKQMIKNMVECLKKCKKASKVAECYGISRFTVIKHGRKAGVPILSRGGIIENITKNKSYQ